VDGILHQVRRHMDDLAVAVHQTSMVGEDLARLRALHLIAQVPEDIEAGQMNALQIVVTEDSEPEATCLLDAGITGSD